MTSIPKTTIIFLLFLAPFALGQRLSDCPESDVTFEIVTGYVYTAPADMLDSQPGSLMLTDCIATCASNSSCQAINYETGLCVMFSSSADQSDGELTPSQFPVFTIYVQKVCLSSASSCGAAWAFERVIDRGMDGLEAGGAVRKRGVARSRQDCQQECLQETEFACRSAMYDRTTRDCQLLDQDRHTLAGTPFFARMDGVDYLEVNCKNIDEKQNRLCVYDRVEGKILKTVDSVYQAIASKEDCEDLCNNAPFKCRGYDFNDTGDNVCRLSHHSAHSLTQIEEPYLFIEDAVTYELSACYNVTIECHSGDMTANIHTTTRFDGKVYAKGSPATCVVDVDQSLDFSITMGYNDLDCGVDSSSGPGIYTNEVIIQHHDRIVTSEDLGLSLTCQYDLSNKSVSNFVDLTVTGEIAPSLTEEAVVDSPNVVMRVEDARSGQDTKTAVVGDPLTMVFEIVDQESSPYEIFVRDLVAVDGATDTELLLVDSRGCPADPSIMGPLRKARTSNKTLESDFDAFRFPTSEVVQFRAMVTPCMPTCEPVVCDVRDYTGQTRSVQSYGRKKRDLDMMTSLMTQAFNRQKRMADPEELLVIKTLKIVDKIGRRRGNQETPKRPQVEEINRGGHQTVSGGELTIEYDDADLEEVRQSGERCLDDTSLLAGAIIFVVAQFLLLVLWLLIWRRRRNQMAKEVIYPDSHHGSASSIVNSSADSLSYIYDQGIPRRMN